MIFYPSKRSINASYWEIMKLIKHDSRCNILLLKKIIPLENRGAAYLKSLKKWVNLGKKPLKWVENKQKCRNLNFMKAGFPVKARKLTSMIIPFLVLSYHPTYHRFPEKPHRSLLAVCRISHWVGIHSHKSSHQNHKLGTQTVRNHQGRRTQDLWRSSHRWHQIHILQSHRFLEQGKGEWIMTSLKYLVKIKIFSRLYICYLRQMKVCCKHIWPKQVSEVDFHYLLI